MLNSRSFDTAFQLSTSIWAVFTSPVGIPYTFSLMYLCFKSAADERWRVTDINGDSLFCLVRTCGTQSLAESDQGFSLCCGLLVSAYEFGPVILPWAKRIWQFVLDSHSILRTRQGYSLASTKAPRLHANYLRNSIETASWPSERSEEITPDLSQRWTELSNCRPNVREEM